MMVAQILCEHFPGSAISWVKGCSLVQKTVYLNTNHKSKNLDKGITRFALKNKKVFGNTAQIFHRLVQRGF